MDSGFKHFEVVATEAKDHHYHNQINGQDAKTSFQNIVIKEWKILEENLPDGIYARAYETRTDLIRAVIIGAPGTPYHDGLFFFDISLPPNYPNAPPKVYYHSQGHRLNPNLYENGYVCLSLVDTWDGSIEEMWTQKSTLLQVLVSIQGLVLNERPYFNEPACEGYRKSKDDKWIRNSIKYSEDAFILSCKTLVQIVKEPPSGFEGLVVAHFRGRAGALLAAVEEYKGGALVAGEESPSESHDTSSFKVDLGKIYSMISDALRTLLNEATTLKESLKRTREEEEEHE